MTACEKKILILFAVCCLQLFARPWLGAQPQGRLIGQTAAPGARDYWQQEVNYTIDVSLNDTEHALDGFIKIQYTNHSPDTLPFLWIHVWPNAYKNDQTALSEQLLANGRTDFYFSRKEQKGYINHLDIRVDGIVARMEDHPQYIDIIKVVLPHPLAPGGKIELTTPFHEQLPSNFSRGGHTGQSYQVTQWYPKPAVYDRKGWHPIPYLDQGEFYSEYGSFDVRITLPKNYVVAATGELQNEAGRQESGNKDTEFPAGPSGPDRLSTDIKKTGPGVKRSPKQKTRGAELKTRQPNLKNPNRNLKTRNAPLKTPNPSLKTWNPNLKTSNQELQTPPSSRETKTLRYKQNNIHDFAWFADKRFNVLHDTLQLASGRIMDVYSYFTPENAGIWKNSIQYMKDAIRYRSSVLGEYPFNVVSAAEVKTGYAGGMEYPTITAITTKRKGKSLDLLLEHEIGHNWFYAILGSDERRYPWMDEGMNTYYNKRYEAAKYPESTGSNWWMKKIPRDPDHLFINSLAKTERDQPISTSSEDFTANNYDLVVYSKAADWMKHLEDSLGTSLFDSCMQEYFRHWQFKHPYPEDFRSLIESTSHRVMNPQFALLDQKGPLTPFEAHKKIRPSFLFSFHNPDKINYVNIMPALGYNWYDQFMAGILIHNYQLPQNNFQFALAPLYATNSRQLNGIGRVSYSWYRDHRFRKIELGMSGARFSTLSAVDTNGNKLFGGFYKAVPSLRLTLKNKSARSTLERWVEWKTYLIGENSFTNYTLKKSDSNQYPMSVSKYAFRYVNQLSFNIEDNRALYPYRALLQLQQASQWYRINFTSNYFFNYSRGGGMGLRLFAAKFGYIGGKNNGLDLVNYEPKLTAVRGNEDYTYSNYFIGRNQFEGAASQQIMMRDGGLKIRTDQFQDLQGRSDNWVAALNLNTTLPTDLVPDWLPLKVFLDCGTYADAWKNNPPTGKFLYVGGLQLSLFRDIVNIYAPLFYSTEFSDQLKTLPNENTLGKRISFSIDIQNLSFRKIFGNIPF